MKLEVDKWLMQVICSFSILLRIVRGETTVMEGLIEDPTLGFQYPLTDRAG